MNMDFSNWSKEDLRTRERIIANMVKNDLRPELAAMACDAWLFLLSRAPNLLDLFERNISLGAMSQYCFVQGFVAGTVRAQTKPNPDN